MEVLKYKSADGTVFEGSIEFSLEDRMMFGKILFINDLILYEGNTIDELEQSFHDAVAAYIEFCKKHDKQPDKPMNGVFNVRVSPDVHKQLSIKALQMNCTLNACVGQAIHKFLNESDVVADSMLQFNQTLINMNTSLSEFIEIRKIDTYGDAICERYQGYVGIYDNSKIEKAT